MKPIVSHPQVEFSIEFTMVYTMVYHIQSWILPEESPTISSIGTFWIETRLAELPWNDTRHVDMLASCVLRVAPSRSLAMGRQQGIKFGAMALRTNLHQWCWYCRCWQMLADVSILNWWRTIKSLQVCFEWVAEQFFHAVSNKLVVSWLDWPLWKPFCPKPMTPL